MRPSVVAGLSCCLAPATHSYWMPAALSERFRVLTTAHAALPTTDTKALIGFLREAQQSNASYARKAAAGYKLAQASNLALLEFRSEIGSLHAIIHRLRTEQTKTKLAWSQLVVRRSTDPLRKSVPSRSSDDCRAFTLMTTSFIATVLCTLLLLLFPASRRLLWVTERAVVPAHSAEETKGARDEADGAGATMTLHLVERKHAGEHAEVESAVPPAALPQPSLFADAQADSPSGCREGWGVSLTHARSAPVQPQIVQSIRLSHPQAAEAMLETMAGAEGDAVVRSGLPGINSAQTVDDKLRWSYIEMLREQEHRAERAEAAAENHAREISLLTEQLHQAILQRVASCEAGSAPTAPAQNDGNKASSWSARPSGLLSTRSLSFPFFNRRPGFEGEGDPARAAPQGTTAGAGGGGLESLGWLGLVGQTINGLQNPRQSRDPVPTHAPRGLVSASEPKPASSTVPAAAQNSAARSVESPAPAHENAVAGIDCAVTPELTQEGSATTEAIQATMSQNQRTSSFGAPTPRRNSTGRTHGARLALRRTAPLPKRLPFADLASMTTAELCLSPARAKALAFRV